jgi:hypothetical protein
MTDENEIEHEEYKGYVIKLIQDTDPMNPRESDDYLMGTMVCFHKRYDLGDKHDIKSENFSGWAEIRTYLEKELGANIVIPLYLLDHSGLWMRAGHNFSDVDSGGWDSGCVGFIYTTPKRIRDMYAIKHITAKKFAQAENELYQEVRTYNDYLTGDVAGYVIEDTEGEVIESCWGYYGETGRKEAMATAKSIVDSLHERWVEKLIDAKVIEIKEEATSGTRN